jgi:hypothetical protein
LAGLNTVAWSDAYARKTGTDAVDGDRRLRTRCLRMRRQHYGVHHWPHPFFRQGLGGNDAAGGEGGQETPPGGIRAIRLDILLLFGWLGRSLSWACGSLEGRITA